MRPSLRYLLLFTLCLTLLPRQAAHAQPIVSHTSDWPARLAAASLIQASPLVTTSVYLPLVYNLTVCATTSANNYASGPVFQRDNDNPVRLAWNHADKNLEGLRGYAATSAAQSLQNIATSWPAQPPQFATLFNPQRVPAFSSVHRAHNWNWGTPPDPGTRGTPITDWPVTALGLQTTPGESLHTPTSAYDLGQNVRAIVLFMDENSIALHYTRDDSAAAGYTVHVDNICPDPNLLALYNQLDTNGARYVYYGSPDGTLDYDLPTLTENQIFGTARSTEIRVAIVDAGAFMDPRSCNDWWVIRPGASC